MHVKRCGSTHQSVDLILWVDVIVVENSIKLYRVMSGRVVLMLWLIWTPAAVDGAAAIYQQTPCFARFHIIFSIRNQPLYTIRLRFFLYNCN